MRAAISLHATDLHLDGQRHWYGCFARIVDLDRTEYQETTWDGTEVYRIPVWPELWRGATHETEDAVQRAEAEAREWATSQGLTLHAMPASRGITGAEADIEANYPGGYKAYQRDERPDGLTPAQEAAAAESGQIAGASGAD